MAFALRSATEVIVPAASSRSALVTGANKGIGYEIARRLGLAGLRVFLGARDPSLGRESAARLCKDGADVQFLEIDLTRSFSIKAAAEVIGSQCQRLDVLVNNAGIVDPADGAPSSCDIAAVRRTMETNFLGALAVSQYMLPLLRKSQSARIVNVSSSLGSITLNGDPEWEFARFKMIGYCASKAALNMLTVQLAYELRDTSIKVNSADPGYTATDGTGHRGPQTVAQGAAEAVRLALLGEDGPTGAFLNAAGPHPW